MGHVYKVLAKHGISRESAFFSDRLIIELCENIHLHYRNLRVEFNRKEFLEFADTFTRARKALTGPISYLPPNSINPYNSTHPEGFENTDTYHREGIELVKSYIKRGRWIRPILVKPEKDFFQRMDGFKRYMAFKELEFEEIPCYVSEKAQRGGQDGEPFLMEV